LPQRMQRRGAIAIEAEPVSNLEAPALLSPWDCPLFYPIIVNAIEHARYALGHLLSARFCSILLLLQPCMREQEHHGWGSGPNVIPPGPPMVNP
jgi:hypothetical protein